ncbi:metalloreductase STEAP3-like [Penaeus japonicus]|uniref:metalloreductase STEAP3-like n=1 Tax=Penaeus japonicus TaxID=27405 RepID=UPI001C712EE5|nr:metalloreductase STEAP3-like [Penaeus japonicus]
MEMTPSSTFKMEASPQGQGPPSQRRLATEPKEKDLGLGGMTSDDPVPHHERKKKVVILGSGDMSLALCQALVRVGMRPVVGSRTPESARPCLRLPGVRVTSVQEALTEGEMVLVAIPAEHHEALPRQLLEGKIVVDVSNRPAESPRRAVSVAECLQGSLPESHVVKAFNTLSAFALQQGNVRGSREVPISSDSEWARGQVSELVRKLGFQPVDFGALIAARDIEEIPFSFFQDWRVAGFVAFLVFFLFYLLLFMRRQICPNIDNSGDWNWDRFQTFPLKNGMLAFALAGTVMLLLCYVPGTIAGYVQLYRGTKYSQFPSWLDRWLKARKQMGLLALLMGSLHGCMAIFTQMGEGMAEPALWSQQLFLALGIVLLGVLAVLGVTSLPSVSAGFTWKEFTFLQRYLGWLSVLLVTGHAFFKGYRKLLVPRFECVVLPSETQIIIVLCFLTILLKLPLLIPCVHSHLMKVRRGYERGPRGSPA